MAAKLNIFVNKEFPMTAKKRPDSPAQPFSTAQPDSLLGSLQAEVSAEASPFLLFLTRHARSLVIVIALCIAGIVGYWIYASQAEKGRYEDTLSYGKILLIADPKTRLEQLESFAGTAPGSVKKAVWFSIMETAGELKDYDTVYRAWKAISDFDPGIHVIAVVGMSDALSVQKKDKEALELLESVSGKLKSHEILLVNARIVLLAENLGDYDKAMAACDTLISKSSDPKDMSMWMQKRAVLEQKKGKAQ